MPDAVNVSAIRKRLARTRVEFANHFGFSPDAVKAWEIGRRTPHRCVRIRLKIVEREPNAVRRALAR